jgi:hypothetical protein
MIGQSAMRAPGRQSPDRRSRQPNASRPCMQWLDEPGESRAPRAPDPKTAKTCCRPASGAPRRPAGRGGGDRRPAHRTGRRPDPDPDEDVHRRGRGREAGRHQRGPEGQVFQNPVICCNGAEPLGSSISRVADRLTDRVRALTQRLSSRPSHRPGDLQRYRAARTCPARSARDGGRRLRRERQVDPACQCSRSRVSAGASGWKVDGHLGGRELTPAGREGQHSKRSLEGNSR